MTQPDLIEVMIGGELRVVDMDLFIAVHDSLADKYRAAGLTGDALDQAINNDLPARLAQMLGGAGATRH